MLKKSSTISMSLILLATQSIACSHTSFQKFSHNAACVLTRTVFSARGMSRYNHNTSKRQQIIVRDIIDSLWRSPIFYERIISLEQVFTKTDYQRTQTIVRECTEILGEEHPEIVKINRWFDEYSRIEAERKI